MNHVLLLRLVNLPLIVMLVVGLATIVVETTRTEEPTPPAQVIAPPSPPNASHATDTNAVEDDPSEPVLDVTIEEDPQIVVDQPSVDSQQHEFESPLSAREVDGAEDTVVESSVGGDADSFDRIDADAISGLVGGVDQVLETLEESLWSLDDSIRNVEQLLGQDRLRDSLTETLPTVASVDSVPAGDEDAPDALDDNIVVLNPALNGHPVSFLIDGRVETLAPGEELQVEGPTNLKFDRGGEFGRHVESLTPGGRYEFHVGGGGWRLDQVDMD